MRPITSAATILAVMASSNTLAQQSTTINTQFSATGRVLLKDKPLDNAGTDTPVGYSFTYQGTLMDGGVPANGEYDMRFYLYNDIPDTIDDPICRDNILVTDGLFTTQLDFGPQFYGDARSLEIAVRPGGALGDCLSPFGYVNLSPRQKITAAPYALGLSLPYAGVQSDPESIFSILNTDEDAESAILGVVGARVYFPTKLWSGVRGEAANGGIGVLGVTDTYYGVTGYADQLDGIGVLGFSNGSTGVGVHGEVTQSDAIAISGFSIDPTGWAAVFNGRSRFDGNVGVKTSSPTTELDVNGTTRTTSLQIPTDAGAGKVLKSDASGNATWQEANDVGYSSSALPNPSTTTQFLTSPVFVTVTEGQSILVTATRLFGTNAVGGAHSLNIYIGYRHVDDIGSPPTTVNVGMLGLSLPQGARVPFGYNSIITGLSPGLYQVGMVGDDDGDGEWHNNGAGTTSIVVFN